MIPAVPDDDDDLEAELYREQCDSLLFDDNDPGVQISHFPIIASFLSS
jgi:hypothetical protein